MPETIISDTSCFIVLTNIGEFEMLEKVYGSVTTMPEVKAEFGSELPKWIEIKSPFRLFPRVPARVSLAGCHLSACS